MSSNYYGCVSWRYFCVGDDIIFVREAACQLIMEIVMGMMCHLIVETSCDITFASQLEMIVIEYWRVDGNLFGWD